MSKPVIVSYGGGVDSTAVLVGMWRRGERPDAILFANTGAERPETYHHIFGVMVPWLAEVGFPTVTVVQYAPSKCLNDPYTTIQGNCLSNGALPAIAIGSKACSVKWKGAPLDAWVDAWAIAKAAYAQGTQVVRILGYDNGPADIRRGKKEDCEKYAWRFPLREWGWDRERCKREIERAGLPVPMKSSCWFCPSNKPAEIAWLLHAHPDLAQGIVAIERRAAVAQTLHGVKGLWGKGTKGMRGAERKPARMTEYLAELGMEEAQAVDFAEIERTTRAMLAGKDELPDRKEKRAFINLVLALQ